MRSGRERGSIVHSAISSDPVATALERNRCVSTSDYEARVLAERSTNAHNAAATPPQQSGPLAVVAQAHVHQPAEHTGIGARAAEGTQQQVLPASCCRSDISFTDVTRSKCLRTRWSARPFEGLSFRVANTHHNDG